MKKLKNLILLNEKDNVAVATKRIDQNERLQPDLLVKDRIKIGFKVALNDINKNDDVIKYGEVIGKASKNIVQGELVHTHNLAGLRGQADKQITQK